MNKKDDFLKKVIIVMASFLLLFTVAMIATFYIMGEVPDSLIAAVFAACLGEGSFCSMIQRTKIQNSIDSDEEPIYSDDSE